MGSRGNIRIHQPRALDDLYLYTHWSGYRVWQILAEGLQRAKDAGRITDPSYATRIIFDTMTGREDDTTGYGIAVGRPDDNEYEIPLLSWPDDHTEPVVVYFGVTYTVDDYIKTAAEGEPL